jgi:hypothetical protein
VTINKKNTVQVFALQEIEKYDRCGVAISMGVGKTRIAIKHLIKNFDSFVKVLVVGFVHSNLYPIHNICKGRFFNFQ